MCIHQKTDRVFTCIHRLLVFIVYVYSPENRLGVVGVEVLVPVLKEMTGLEELNLSGKCVCV